jgi:hypothetical protein
MNCLYYKFKLKGNCINPEELNNNISSWMAPRPCDRCRQRRVRCDRDLSQCNHCKNHNVDCSYNYVTKKRGPKTKVDKDLFEFETIINLDQSPK